jgi:hypothetical protein
MLPIGGANPEGAAIPQGNIRFGLHGACVLI